MLQIIRLTVLTPVLGGHYSFSAYTVAAQLITEVFHLYISFIAVPKQISMYIPCTPKPL